MRLPTHHPITRFLGGSLLAVAVSAAWGQAPDAPIRFDINRFDVAGNTLLPQASIDAALKPMTGKNRDFGDVQRALEAVEAAYHRHGYKLVTVQVPEQELNSGVVRLHVVQTKLGRVTVKGNKIFDEANVRRSLPTLVPGQSPNLDAVSASLKMANENPAKKVSLKLQSGAGEDEVDANLEVADGKPWKAMLNLDNSGSGPTGKTHAGVVLQHANLWGRDHVASLQYTTTLQEPSKVSVYGLGYHIPLYSLGDSVDLFASYSNIDSGTVTAGLFSLAVSGKGGVYGARYNHTLARRGEMESRLSYGLDIKAFKNTVLFAGANFGNDITVRPASINYSANMPMGVGDANLSFTLVRNLPGGSRGSDADYARTRVGAKPAYTIARFSVALSRPVMSDWQGRLLVNGQYSGDALVPGEQFGIGGGTSVRGLDERGLATDSGLQANLELYTPNLCTARTNWQCRMLAFYDVAHGTRNKALPGELKSATAGSVGLGLRFAMGNAVNLQIDYGHVVQDEATTGGNDKVHIRVGFAY
jgi:hemolysin activation/secretion protein